MFVEIFCLTSAENLTTTSVPTVSESFGYFNSSLGSYVNISSTGLQLINRMSFSFKTCSKDGGVLLHQVGGTGDYISFALTTNGYLALSWKVNSNVDNITFGDNNLADSDWYKIDINFALVSGQVNLAISKGSAVLSRTILSNNTFRQYLRNINLSGGSPLQLGMFSGCLAEGPQVFLSSANKTWSNVAWGGCPNNPGCSKFKISFILLFLMWASKSLFNQI